MENLQTCRFDHIIEHHVDPREWSISQYCGEESSHKTSGTFYSQNIPERRGQWKTTSLTDLRPELEHSDGDHERAGHWPGTAANDQRWGGVSTGAQSWPERMRSGEVDANPRHCPHQRWPQSSPQTQDTLAPEHMGDHWPGADSATLAWLSLDTSLDQIQRLEQDCWTCSGEAAC